MIHEHVWIDIGGNCCAFKKCSICDVIKKTMICSSHAALHKRTEGKEYFISPTSKFYRDGYPNNVAHMKELKQALDGMKYRFLPRETVLETGAGVGHIVPFFLKNQNYYEANDIDGWACECVANMFDVPVYQGNFLWCKFPKKYDHVISCHMLEHVNDPECCLQKMYNISKKGVVILIPDATDLYNPDHLTFWSVQSIERWMKETGFYNVRFFLVSMGKEKYIWICGEK